MGTLLISILIDPDHFLLDSEGFEKMFIFVHFAHSMNQGSASHFQTVEKGVPPTLIPY